MDLDLYIARQLVFLASERARLAGLRYSPVRRGSRWTRLLSSLGLSSAQ